MLGGLCCWKAEEDSMFCSWGYLLEGVLLLGSRV